jgi:tetratricopeptide (TPR) repeat protein
MMFELLTLPRKLVPEEGDLVAGAECRLATYLVAWERDYVEAAKMLENALRSYPNTRWEAELRYRCGHALEAIGRTEDAITHFKAAAYGCKDSVYSTPSLYETKWESA